MLHSNFHLGTLRVRTLLLSGACCITALPHLWSAEAQAQTSVELLIDGKAFLLGSEEVRVPAFHRSVSFRLGKSAQEDPEGCRRMRFKLGGVDEDWRQIASEMCVLVRFADAQGDQVGQRLFPVDGTSSGWRGAIENSTFNRRLEHVRVPPGAVSATMAISSSGPPTAMGVYVVRNLRISGGAPTAARLIYETGSSIEPDAKSWVRSGTRPSMAKIVPTNEGDAFCILDDDPGAHAEWSLARAGAPRVQAGERLTVEWSEMYDIGMGNRFDVNYGHLNAGAYTLWSEELDATGRPFATASQLEFIVLEPYWKSIWFWIGTSAATGLLLWLGCRAIIQWRIRQHLAKVEQERMLEHERLRIARDLHDDLGARLTHISLMSGLAENDPQSAASRESFQRISGMARELVAALYQTVWTVNPEHDNLEALVNYLCQLTQNLAESARIRCRIHSCEVPDQRPVTSEVRHNITLAVKEALNNAVKHAGATEICVRIEFNDPRLSIAITDNGHGFDATQAPQGNGLKNMQRRMESVGGSVTIQSTPEGGTAVCFEVSIAAAASTKRANSSPT
jgi:signal transduction histidine kinase